MCRFKQIFLVLTFLFAGFNLQAQLDLEDFQLSGVAMKLDEQCIRLVPDVQYVSGSAWYKRPIDLSQPFEMEVCLVLGEKDLDGADGIVFVFHPYFARTGWRGEGMGFAGLRPSLGIEFDTYLNYHLADPAEDHISVMANGATHHAYSLVKPVTVPNLEDGERHIMRIRWEPDQELLQLFLDNELRVAYSADIVNAIFGGNSTVFWGVTAATGRLSNNHEICIKKLIFAEAKLPEGATPEGLAQQFSGHSGIQFRPGTTELYPDSKASLDSLANYLDQNTLFSVAFRGHATSADGSNYNQILSGKRLLAVKEYLVSKGIAGERVLIADSETLAAEVAGATEVQQEVGWVLFVPDKE